MTLANFNIHPAISLHASQSDEDTFTVSMYCREDNSWLHTTLNTLDEVFEFYSAFSV